MKAAVPAIVGLADEVEVDRAGVLPGRKEVQLEAASCEGEAAAAGGIGKGVVFSELRLGSRALEDADFEVLPGLGRPLWGSPSGGTVVPRRRWIPISPPRPLEVSQTPERTSG